MISCANKGLNGDLDRLPMLTWIMLLKFLDDLGLRREQEWQFANTKKSTPHPGPLPIEAERGKGLQMASAEHLCGYTGGVGG